MIEVNKGKWIIPVILVLLSGMVTADVTISVSADKTTVNPGDVVTFTVTATSTTGHNIVHRICDINDMISGESCHEDSEGPIDTPHCNAGPFDGVFEVTVPSTQAHGTYTIQFIAKDDNPTPASAATTIDITVEESTAPDPGIIETIGGINNLLYGIAAGIAILMITIHAVKWKTASSPADREEAKRGIINVILGLIVIIIAAALVALIYVKPEDVASTITLMI